MEVGEEKGAQGTKLVKGEKRIGGVRRRRRRVQFGRGRERMENRYETRGTG